VGAGLPVLLTVHVAGVTKGTPTGTIVLSDGATILAAADASISGDLAFSTSAFAAGPHSLNAAYSGDTNFQPSTSPTALFTVSTPPPSGADFTLAPSGATTQTIASGTSADFTFTMQMQGSLSGPITFAASGLPDLASASFNPGSITPGSTSASFTMTVATQKTAWLDQSKMPFVFALLLPLAVFGLDRKRGFAPKLVVVFLLCSPLIVLSGCGDRINHGGAGSGAVPTKTYPITVIGTALNNDGSLLRHTAVVTLVLQNSQ
jgi:uncharacterized protein YceK